MQCVFKVDYPPSLRHQKHCMQIFPFNQRTSAILSRLLRIPTGGLKGKIAPSAMPTLAVGAFLLPFFGSLPHGFLLFAASPHLPLF